MLNNVTEQFAQNNTELNICHSSIISPLARIGKNVRIGAYTTTS